MWLAFLVPLLSTVSAHGNLPVWNQLSVNLGKYSPLPMHEDEAISEGWKLLHDNCEDRGSSFVGRRYLLDGDHATILIYDVHGQVAGIQLSYKAFQKEGHFKKYRDVLTINKEKDSYYIYQTAYFTEPANICNEKIIRPAGIVGDKLSFLVAPNTFLDVPLLENDVAGKWVKGYCYEGMGTHYWYDLSKDMQCDDMFPMVILYNKQGQLHGFGFISDVHLTGPRIENPPFKSFPKTYMREEMRKCLAENMQSTQHIYLTKVGPSSHLC